MAEDTWIIRDTSNNSTPLELYTPIESYNSYENVTNLLFINSSLEYKSGEFSKYLNTNTYPLVYNYHTDRESVVEFLGNFKNLKRIAFAFHGPLASGNYDNNSFINKNMYFTHDDISNDQTHFSENVLFVKKLIQDFSLTNIDFLACNTLLHDNWVKYFNLLQHESNVIIGASDDDTGNIKYGGDWVVENTMENIKTIYFNNTVDNYANVLSALPGIRIGDFVYEYDSTNFTAMTSNNDWQGATDENGENQSTTAASWQLTSPSPAVIPETIVIFGDTYTVTRIDNYTFNGSNITTLTIPKSITQIDNVSIYNAYNLTSVIVDVNNLDYSSVNGVLFNKSQTILLRVPQKLPGIVSSNYHIPNTVTEIGHTAFEHCPIASVTISSNVTRLSYGAFRFTNLESIVIPRYSNVYRFSVF